MSNISSLTARDLAPGYIAAPYSARSQGWLVYYFAWGILAIAAAVYLTAVTVKPDFLVNWFPTLGKALSQPQGNDAANAGAAQEAAELRKTLVNTQMHVQQLRHQLADRDATIKSSNLRISELQQSLAELQKSSTAAAPAAPTEALAETGPSTTPAPPAFEMVNGPSKAAPTETSSVDEVDIPPPTRRPTDIPQRAAAAKPTGTITQIVRPTVAVTPTKPDDAGAQIETGSVATAGSAAVTKPKTAAAAPIAFGPPVVTRSPAQVGVRLSAAPSVDALRLSWGLLTERHGAELGNLEPRYTAGNAPSAPYALIAGPVGSEQEAKDLCARLISKGISCNVDSFKGNAL